MARTPEQLLRRVFPPMLATLTDAPPADDRNWAYELKYDGFRALTAIVDGKLAMWSRNELNLAPRFPTAAAAMAKLKCNEVVLDGEIVAVDENGVPRFQLLQGGEHAIRTFIFDVLWLDGEDLRKKTYVERRAILEKLLKRPPAGVELARKVDVSGEEALKEAKRDGWEGVIGKRRISVYEGRRSKEWIKLKALNEQELVIIGFNYSSATARQIGALHLGFMGDDGQLHYGGKVGTGFTAKMRGELREMLGKDVVEKSAAVDAPRGRDAIWVKPRYVAQVAFTEWTSDNRLRHPSFLGLRPDKGVKEVVKEKPSTLARFKITNPDRVLYPKDKITKQQIIDYYDAVSEPMLRALRDRPLSLEHWNKGIHEPSWFHQDVGPHAPDWLTTIDTPTRTTKSGTVKHLAVDSKDALRWLGQMSILTVHMWHSHVPSLESPDWI